MSSDSKKSFLLSAWIPFLLVLMMWFVHYINISKNLGLHRYGIHPGGKNGLKGILFSPFIHSTRDFSHIINNSAPIFILSWSLIYFYRKIAWLVFIVSWLAGGFLVWLIARDNYHIGMSGIIYSLAFFLFFSGVFRKDTRLMAISMFVVFLYGSMVWGIFPLDPSVSHESHLMGGVVGLILAFLLKNHGATFKRKKYQWEIDEELEKEMEKKGYTQIVDEESGFVIRYEYKPKEEEKEE